jgi:hypothetical protein
MVFTGIVLVLVVSLTEGFTVLIGILIVLIISTGDTTKDLSGVLGSSLLSKTLDMVITIILHITDIIIMDTEIMLTTDLFQTMIRLEDTQGIRDPKLQEVEGLLRLLLELINQIIVQQLANKGLVSTREFLVLTN